MQIKVQLSCKLDNALPNVLNWDIYMLSLRKGRNYATNTMTVQRILKGKTKEQEKWSRNRMAEHQLLSVINKDTTQLRNVNCKRQWSPLKKKNRRIL